MLRTLLLDQSAESDVRESFDVWGHTNTVDVYRDSAHGVFSFPAGVLFVPMGVLVSTRGGSYFLVVCFDPGSVLSFPASTDTHDAKLLVLAFAHGFLARRVASFLLQSRVPRTAG